MDLSTIDSGNPLLGLAPWLDSPLLPDLFAYELPKTSRNGMKSEVGLDQIQDEYLKLLEEQRRKYLEALRESNFSDLNNFTPVDSRNSYSVSNSIGISSSRKTIQQQSDNSEENLSIDTTLHQIQPKNNTQSISPQQLPLAGEIDQELTSLNAPFPTDVVQEKLDQADNPDDPEPQKIIPPIFQGYSPPVNLDGFKKEIDEPGQLVLKQGAELIFEKELFDNVGQAGQQNFKFYWESNDSILGHIQATIDTESASAMEQSYIKGDNSRPPRLVFTGSGDGAEFSGNVIFGTYNRMVVDVVKGSQRVRYLLEDEKNPACEPCRAGDVIQENGEVTQSETLLNIPGRQGASSALDYAFTLEYRSNRNTTGLAGSQWNHNNFERLEIQIDGSILHNNGLERKDLYLSDETGDGFQAPPQFFTSLQQNSDGSFTLREADGTSKNFDPNGNLLEIRDRNDNFVTLEYNAQGRMSQFVDTLGRAIDYEYIDSGVNAGRLDKVVDFSGRVVDLTYDDKGDLVAITSPVVTTDGNAFPEGKTINYTYSSGFADENLNHNLLTVTQPNEVASGGPPTLVYEYGTSDLAFDKVISKTKGGIDASGVEAGGTHTYEYKLLAPGVLTGDPNQPISLFREIDRNGNKKEYEFNPLGYTIAIREFTKGLRKGEPKFFETRYEYNADGRLLRQIDPEGNVMPYFYDESNDSRFAQGNAIVSRQLPDDRGGDQSQITTLSLYEPIYQQVSLSIDPRGIDENFIPPINDPSGRSQLERYSTRYFFDYQEANAAVILPLLADKLGISQAEVQNLLDGAGVTLGLGDINLDGVISTSVAGNILRMEQPSAILLAGSHQAEIEGDRLQDNITLYRYNQFGQITSMVDPEGNVDINEYFSESDPDGNGVPTIPADGRTLNTTTGGYLKQEIRDAAHLSGANNGNGVLPTAISTKYEYDPVGNIISMTDGRGIRTEYVVNELNQVVRTIQAAAVPASGAGNTNEPLDLDDFAYIEDVKYDHNDNVITRRIEDRGNTSNTGGFVDYTYTYDILDNLVTETQEVDINTTLTTRYRYDANENLTLTLLPEGNATTSQYDERDLLFQTTQGALNATLGTLSAPTSPYNPRGGIPSTTTYHYDSNRNLIEIVDADDTDRSTGNKSSRGGIGDVTKFIFDGFDRRIAVIDAVGNKTMLNYDPVSNIIRERTFGLIGGASPKNNKGTNNVLLSETTYLYDELNRNFQEDYNLFVSNGVKTVRPANIKDGSLTPNDNKVTMRYEYDRKSRQTFIIQDDEDTYRTDYDGADRQIKTLDPEGNTVEYAYDDNSNLIETKETDKAQIAGIANEVFLTTYFYDSLNRVQQTVDNIGQAMFYRYDSRGNLVAMADAQGPVTWETINRRAFAKGALTVNAINDFGNVTRYFYDGIGRQIREEQILTASGEGDGVNIGATLEGIKTTIPTPDPSQGGGDGIIRTGYVYDDNSLLSALIDDRGNVTVYLYDNLNRQVTETKGLTVNSTLTKANILGARQIVTPTAATINNPDIIAEPLINNQLSEIEDRLDEIASLFLSQADQVDDNPPTTIVYGYSPDNNLFILEDENDSETFTQYDAINRRIATRVFRSGQSDSFIGDPIFAPNPVSDPSHPSTTFPAVIGTNKMDYQYDGLSRLRRATDNNNPTDSSDDSVVTYAYDSLSRVIEETQKIGSLPVQATSSAWEADTRSSVTYPNGRKLVYTYDELDRIQSISDNGASQATVEYDYIGTGRVLERRSPTNGTRMTYLNDAGNTDTGYDGLRRTTQLRHLDNDNTLIVGFEYGYDRMDNRTFQRKLHDSDNSELYSYDSSYCLIDFQRGTLNAAGDAITTPSTNVSQGQQWDLDGVGNWDETIITDENGVDTTDNREHSSFNELTTQNGATLRYDDNGNLVEDAEYTYQYDAFNRLRVATRKADGVVAEYSYDAVGRRIIKEVSNSGALNGVTYFYHDGMRELEERNGSNVLKQQYVYGNYIDEVLVLDRNLNGDNSAIGVGDERFHYHQDALYSVYALTDETGEIAESYLYDPYGEVTVFDASGNLVPNNTFGTANSLIDNPFLFTGRRLDEETGLYYYRARYFDADQGRFISRDLLKYSDGENLYNGYFVPNQTDPYGLKAIKVGFYGAGNPPGGWQKLIDAKADRQYTSLQTHAAFDYIIKELDTNNDGVVTDSDCLTDVRIVGYSWGGWSALGVAKMLDTTFKIKEDEHRKVQLGLLDPVRTGRLGIARLPSNVVYALNIYQRNGCYDTGGRGCPGPSWLFRGTDITGADNRNVTDDGIKGKPKEEHNQKGPDGVPFKFTPDHIHLGIDSYGKYDEQVAAILDR